MYSSLQLMHRVGESSAANSAVVHISRFHALESFIGNYLGVSAAEETQGDLRAAFQYLKGATREKGRYILQGHFVLLE